MIDETVGIIGGTGWLGGAIAKALLAKALLPAGRLVVSNRSGEHPLAQQGVCLVANNQLLVDRSDVIVIAVRPEHFAGLNINATGKIVVSLMAGIKAQTIAERTWASVVIRAMPNAAVEIGQSFTPWYCCGETAAATRNLVQQLFESVGTAAQVQEEDFIDYLSALSGTGPAFPALLMTALADQAVAAGIPPDIARLAAKNVVVNSSQLLSNHDPRQMIDALVAYRGVTAAALQVMTEGGLEEQVGRALQAGAAVARKGLQA